MVLSVSTENILETDRVIIQKINEDPESFLDLTINEFATKIHTAISTASKFVRRIGFENYRTFQKYLSKSYMLQKENNLITLIDVNHQDAAFALKSCDSFVLNETIKKINFQTLNKLVDQLINAHKIWTIGEGNSFLAANDLANALNTIGFIAFATNDIYGHLQQLEVLNNHDVVIFISERFEQREYQELILKLKKQKVPLGLITAVDPFFVDKKTDFVINFFAFSQQNRPEVVGNVKMQQIFINNLLINTIIKKKEIYIAWDTSTKW